MVRMTDTEREQAIAQAREDMMQAALHRDWPAAHAAQERMRALIRQRSDERVAQMESTSLCVGPQTLRTGV